MVEDEFLDCNNTFGENLWRKPWSIEPNLHQIQKTLSDAQKCTGNYQKTYAFRVRNSLWLSPVVSGEAWVAEELPASVRIDILQEDSLRVYTFSVILRDNRATASQSPRLMAPNSCFSTIVSFSHQNFVTTAQSLVAISECTFSQQVHACSIPHSNKFPCYLDRCNYHHVLAASTTSWRWHHNVTVQ